MPRPRSDSLAAKGQQPPPGLNRHGTAVDPEEDAVATQGDPSDPEEDAVATLGDPSLPEEEAVPTRRPRDSQQRPCAFSRPMSRPRPCTSVPQSAADLSDRELSTRGGSLSHRSTDPCVIVSRTRGDYHIPTAMMAAA